MEPAPKRDLRNTSPEVRGGWRLTNRRQIKPDPGPLWPTLKRGMGEPRAARFVGCRFEGSWLPYPASKILPETWVGGAGKRPRDGPPCRKSAKYSLHAYQTRSVLPGPIQRAADCRDPRNHSCAGGGEPGRSRKRGSHDIQHDGDPCHPAGGRGISSPHQHRHVVTRGGSLTDSCEPDDPRLTPLRRERLSGPWTGPDGAPWETTFLFRSVCGSGRRRGAGAALPPASCAGN